MVIKKIVRSIALILLSIIGVLVLYVFSALILSVIPVNKNPITSSNIVIYLLSNGDHTDIVVPVKNSLKDWSTEIKYENTITNDTTAQYIAIGWGNKDFYLNTPTWAQFKLSLGIKSILGMGTSAIHTDFCKTLVVGNNCKKVMISNDQYIKLIKYIEASFKKNAIGQVINIKTHANYDNTDAFYEANGTYSLFYTCNTWANDALKACGQRACLWTPFDKGIFYQYRD